MLSKDDVRSLRTELQHHLDAISEQVGYKLTLGNASFGATASFKLEAAPINENGEATSKTAEDFKRGAMLFGLKATDLGATFSSNGHAFKIVGLKALSRKFPILAQRADGRMFKFPAEMVKMKLSPERI